MGGMCGLEKPAATEHNRGVTARRIRALDCEDHWLRGYGFHNETCDKRDGQRVLTSRRQRRVTDLTSPLAVIREHRVTP